MDTKEKLLSQLAPKIQEKLRKIDLSEVEEIRLRVGRPICVSMQGKCIFVGNWRKKEGPDCVQPEDLAVTLELLSRYSLYAVQEELRQGFFTIPGGHRIGVAGKTVVENGQIMGFRGVSSLCLRICRQIDGCGQEALSYIYGQGGLQNTLLLSPPGCGKTTLLRDLVRLMSEAGLPIGVVDERGELAGAYGGVPQLDVGPNTDVLDGCPKAQGMMMLLRSMAPKVIAADEIGSAEDVAALGVMQNAGVSLLCTAHGGSMEELEKKQLLLPLLAAGAFTRFILIHNNRQAEIYDENKVRMGEVSLCSSR